MKLAKICCFILLLISLTTFTSCVRLYGNHVYFCKIENITNFTYSNIQFDLENKTFKHIYNVENNITYSEYIVDGGTAPRYIIDIKEGYENIEDDILSLNTLDDHSVIYTTAFLKNDYVYGIINVYEKTVGYLSGGGNYGEEEIAYSIYYKYDNTSDTMETLCKLSDATMLAFSGDYLVYWKDKAFYSYNIISNVETKLCDHLSYDSGSLHHSSTSVYFDDDYVIIEMRHVKIDSENYYVYLYEFGRDIVELQQIE